MPDLNIVNNSELWKPVYVISMAPIAETLFTGHLMALAANWQKNKTIREMELHSINRSLWSFYKTRVLSRSTSYAVYFGLKVFPFFKDENTVSILASASISAACETVMTNSNVAKFRLDANYSKILKSDPAFQFAAREMLTDHLRKNMVHYCWLFWFRSYFGSYLNSNWNYKADEATAIATALGGAIIQPVTTIFDNMQSRKLFGSYGMRNSEKRNPLIELSRNKVRNILGVRTIGAFIANGIADYSASQGEKIFSNAVTYARHSHVFFKTCIKKTTTEKDRIKVDAKTMELKR